MSAIIHHLFLLHSQHHTYVRTHSQDTQTDPMSSTNTGAGGIKRPRRVLSSSSLAGAGDETGSTTSGHAPTAYGEEDETLQPFLDFSYLTLRKHHESKPLWVCPNLRIYLEAFSPLYKHAYDFLIAICEPVARPTYVHEYKLTSYSLYAAVAVNIHTEHILSTLGRFSKNELPDEVVSFIRRSTETYGKAKLLLRDNEYFIEAESKEIARKLLRNEVIKEARIAATNTTAGGGAGLGTGGGGAGGGGGDGDFIEGEAAKEMTENIEFMLAARAEGEEEDDDLTAAAIHGAASQKTAMFKIAQDRVRRVKEAALMMDPPYPLMEEYDFRKDTKNKPLQIMLKSTTKVRTYQQKSLRMMFGNGRARSGIIVLPCGAGKTLTGERAIHAHIHTYLHTNTQAHTCLLSFFLIYISIHTHQNKNRRDRRQYHRQGHHHPLQHQRLRGAMEGPIQTICCDRREVPRQIHI